MLVVDELAYYSATVGDKRQRDTFSTLLRDLVARGRAAGIIVVVATQRPSHDIIPTSLRDLFGYRLAFRCTTDTSSDIVLGHGWDARGYDASDHRPRRTRRRLAPRRGRHPAPDPLLLAHRRGHHRDRRQGRVMERIQHGATEFRVLMAAVTTVLVAGCCRVLSPALGGLVWLSAALLGRLGRRVLAAVRRELRIRRRLAQIQPPARAEARR